MRADPSTTAPWCASHPVKGAEVLTICWTSGTEAQPKGVPRNHNEWLIVGQSVVDAGQLGDTVRVTSGGDTAVTVAASDSLAPRVRLQLAYPTRTIVQVRDRRRTALLVIGSASFHRECRASTFSYRPYGVRLRRRP